MNARVVIPDTTEARLKAAMVDLFEARGFTALRLTLAKLEAEIGQENRVLLALQGWIA
jgi:hypothetical protein